MSEHEALARFHYGCAARTTMEMQGWARIADRDIAEQRQDLDLLTHPRIDAPSCNRRGMHRIWVSGEEFDFGGPAVTAKAV
jgi:hypothetical protein